MSLSRFGGISAGLTSLFALLLFGGGGFGLGFRPRGRRARNRRDGEVAVGDGRRYAGREGHRRNVYAVADVDARKINRDLFGNSVGWAREFNRVPDDVQDA